MRLWAAVAGFVSLLTGMPLSDAATAELDGRGREEAASPSSGHRVEGELYYVWDEDSREAERWAAELAATKPLRRTPSPDS
jgi:hypothetical protein